MSADSNSSSSGFYSSSSSGVAIKFQSGAINCDIIPMYSGLVGSGSGAGLVRCGSSCGIESVLVDSVEPGLKHDAGVAVEWSVEEQYKLELGLERYSAEPTIIKYVMIAATLRDKTVRDVALRCRWWMSRKRRKSEELNTGKKVNNRKLEHSSSKINVSSTIQMSMAAYSLMMQPLGQSEHMPFNGLSCTAKNMLEQNAHDFSQITANLSTFKLQENIDLFRRTRNNLAAILNDMNGTPGIMSQMPPLPVSVDDDLISSILHDGTQGPY